MKSTASNIENSRCSGQHLCTFLRKPERFRSLELQKNLQKLRMLPEDGNPQCSFGEIQNPPHLLTCTNMGQSCAENDRILANGSTKVSKVAKTGFAVVSKRKGNNFSKRKAAQYTLCARIEKEIFF